MGKREQLPRLLQLLRQQRWAALATVDHEGEAAASMVAYAPATHHPTLYLHLSRLAAHTEYLLRHPRCAMVLGEADNGQGDPQQLARLSLSGTVKAIGRDEDQFSTAQALYLQRLPSAKPLFDFADFLLLEFSIASARFVGGFAQAHSYSREELQTAWGGFTD